LAAALVIPASFVYDVVVVPFCKGFAEGWNQGRNRRNAPVPAPLPSPSGLPAIPPEVMPFITPPEQARTWRAIGNGSGLLSLARQAAELAENAKDQAMPDFCTFRPRVLIWDATDGVDALATQAMDLLPEDLRASSPDQELSIVVITGRTRGAVGSPVPPGA